MVDSSRVIADFIAGITLSLATIPQYWTEWNALTGGETSLGVVGTSIFVGPIRPESDYIPANSIFTVAYDDTITKTFDNLDETVSYYVSINVRAKHATDSRQYGFLKSAIIYDFLQRKELTGYLDIKAVNAANQMPYDEQNNAVFILNAAIMHNQKYAV